MSYDLQALRRRTVEIDYRHKHRHLPGSLSALPIIAAIYEVMKPRDVFILSKGHACAALYAVLESKGFRPDVSLVHPERDVGNGVEITAGSLGHGLPIAVGMAWAKKRHGEPGYVHVLLGDGECQEGTTWESLSLASRLGLEKWLTVHIDNNHYQGSDELLSSRVHFLPFLFPQAIVIVHDTKKGHGVKMFESKPEKSVHLVTDAEYAEIMAELSPVRYSTMGNLYAIMEDKVEIKESVA